MPRLFRHLRLPQVRVDWREVWEAFKREHGEPVQYRGLLLFPDAWTHASADLRGPEWPPPENPNERRTMMLHYWLIRRKVVKVERDYWWNTITQVREVQRSRSVPVPVYVRSLTRDDDTGKLKLTRHAVSPDDWEAGRLNQLNLALAECEEKIRELQHATETNSQPAQRQRAAGARPA